MQTELEAVVRFLGTLAGDGDSASIQINNDGQAILRIGVNHTEHLSVEEFAKMAAEGAPAE